MIRRLLIALAVLGGAVAFAQYIPGGGGIFPVGYNGWDAGPFNCQSYSNGAQCCANAQGGVTCTSPDGGNFNFVGTLSPAALPNLPSGAGAPLSWYANAASGIDSPYCGASPSTPCATIQQTYDNVPKALRCFGNVIDLTGTFDGGGAYIGGNWSEEANCVPATGQGPYLKFIGHPPTVTPTTGPATGTFTSATAGGGGSLNGSSPGGAPGPASYGTATLSGAGWTVNNFAGDLLTITGGHGIGQNVRILSNTATVITILGMWPLNVTPNSTSTFTITSPQAAGGTVINGTLAQPGGAFGTGYLATSGAQTSAFYVSSEQNSAYESQLYGSEAQWTARGSIFDPQVDFEGIYFDLGNSGQLTAVSTSGAGAVGFRYNDVLAGNGVATRGGDIWFESNWCAPGWYGCVVGGTPIGGGFHPAQASVEIISTYVAGSGGGDAVFEGTARTLIAAFNHTANNSGANTGLRYGGDTDVLSVGNDWNGNTYGLRANYGFNQTESYTGLTTEDGDRCTSVGTCVYIRGTGTLDFISDALTGSGNTVVVDVAKGSAVFDVVPTATGTTAIEFGTGTYTFAQITAGTVVALSDGTSIALGASSNVPLIDPGDVIRFGTVPAATLPPAACSAGSMLWWGDAGPNGLPIFCENGGTSWETLIGPTGTGTGVNYYDGGSVTPSLYSIEVLNSVTCTSTGGPAATLFFSGGTPACTFAPLNGGGTLLNYSATNTQLSCQTTVAGAGTFSVHCIGLL